MSQLLQFLWQQLRPRKTHLSAETVNRWPEGRLDELLEQKLVVLSDIPATSIRCDACDADHSAKVVWLDYPDGQRAFISCPEVGRVEVEAERLKQWEIDFELLAVTVTKLLPGKLTREGIQRIHSVQFTPEDQSNILDLLGNFAPQDATLDQKRIDNERLQAILPHLTRNQQAILTYLWPITVSVCWDQLPDKGFREGNNRSDGATTKALERLDTTLALPILTVKAKLQINRPERRVTLIRDRFRAATN